MKCFLDWAFTRGRFLTLVIFVAIGGWAVSALGELPSWIRDIEAGSAVEMVFFRMMSLPGGPVLFRRPPQETRPALAGLIETQPHNPKLYSLRALEDEQQLDFAAAESDWKSYVENSSDKISAEFSLADFYHRRLRPVDEIKMLSVIAPSPRLSAERLAAVPQQRSWQAFERIFQIIQEQGLPKDVSIAQYRAWISRYPEEQSLYARFLQFLVASKEYASAGQLIPSYQKQFPDDEVFPLKAKAMVEYRQWSVREGLAVYEKSFQPLWDPELVKSYFDLLRETQNLRKFRDDAHAAVIANPENLDATSRLFYYYQQQGKVDIAEQAIASFRLHKEASKSEWTSQELYVFARLLEDVHSYPESARYYFALYNSQGLPEAQALSIAGLTNILLTAPETAIRFGSGELSMYRDIATMDQGPGYLNGILSLILNTTQPAAQYSEEEQRATPYFHRSRAAELLDLLDTKFPNSSRRPELHSKLLEFYSNTGESDAAIQGGRDFLANFPHSSERTSVALLMADAYARKDDTKNEFAIYDSVLQELAAKSQNMPIGAGEGTPNNWNYKDPNHNETDDAEGEDGEEEGESESRSGNAVPRHGTDQSFQVGTTAPEVPRTGARSPEYARVLERYLARLVEMHEIPSALGLLRREIDRNPDDPGLYERLAVFLDQNRLGEQQEEIYRRAISRFADRSWYDKLARFYLRYKKESEYEQLTREAVKTFSGSDLERYFYSAPAGSPALYLRLNQYANQRFPHNPVFIRNLLAAYHSRETYNDAAWEALLRGHWFENVGLRNMFLEFLSRSGRLESELNAFQQSAPDEASWKNNPAAADFLAYANLWRSHFEESAPVFKSLAMQYPADAELGRDASSVYRSLGYIEPADTVVAARIEDNLLHVNPRDTEIMARIGDIYADRALFAQAAPYWERIPLVAPGQSGGYLEAATIYWDYYDFDNALRLLNKGRDQLSDHSLYSYEAGAIYENKRDYSHAVEEYVKGALAASGSSAERRLLQLARRPGSRDLVDQSTAKIAASPNPPMSAVYLRVKVLEAQNRRPELEALLNSIVNSTTSIEQAEDIEKLAREKSLETARQRALEKQAVLTSDPVNRMQLRYSLVQLYESRKDFLSAQKNVEALYHENPKILGIVRFTADYYWRNKMQSQAISVLLQAAKDAYPNLSTQFTFEAARKSTEAKQYQQARDLLYALLKDSPYNAEYLAAAADTYAQARDDRGLEQFYLAQIALMKNAHLSPDARKAQIATLRRGIIPALTRMSNYSGAVDQYIELINNFPEDNALVTEASLYALRYQRKQQLVNFYSKTVVQSPRDYRWSMVLARMQTDMENYPAAIETYSKSIAIRPDRVDLYTARAGLEERLMRFDDAAADYERIYQLAYKDPQWMEKIAEVRARQGKISLVAAALQAALITGRPENAGSYFEVARRLESWGMLVQARSFAEQGIKITGTDLLANADNHPGANTYIRIMTRLRQHEQAYVAMQKSVADAASNLPILKEQIEKLGIAGLTDARWREHVRQARTEAARDGMKGALVEMGKTVDTYFTPEERVGFAHFAESQCSGMNVADLEIFAIPLAQSAALSEQEARWRLEVMMKASLPNFYSDMQPFIDLQRRRGQFAELAMQLEQYAKVLPPLHRDAPLFPAADAYRSAGDPQNELRILSSLPVDHLDNARQRRLFQLLLERQPQQLVQISSDWRSASGEQAADYVVAHDGAGLSHSVVQARGQARQPVWGKAYNALVGLYFLENTPGVKDSFVSALGDDPIGLRLSKPVDRTQQLAGNIWFYYGSRYGEYLGASKQKSAEDFLPAILEESPATASGYLTLADYYIGAGDGKHAIADYNHTLDFAPNRPDAYDKLAIAYDMQGDRAAALGQWKQAFAVLLAQINGARVPESFWADFGRTCDQLAARHIFLNLKPEANAILRAYLGHNGNYRSNALLHSVYVATGSSSSATAWMLDLSSAANDPTLILADLVDASWIPSAQRAPIYQRILETKQASLSKLAGLERENAQQELDSWQVRWIGYLVRSKQYALAAAAIRALPKETRDAQAAALVPLDLRVAAQLGMLDATIAGYRTESQSIPDSKTLRTAARQLFEAGDKESARKVLEFVFGREIEEHQLVASNFLGLAEIRLASGDTSGALDLLRRLAVVVGNPFENLDPAAALLEKTGNNAEAIEFLDQLVKSAPWDPSYRLRLAKAKVAAGKDASAAQDALTSIASDSNTSYDLRVRSAIALAGKTHSNLGSEELNLLAEKPEAITSAAADRFYFYEARIQAAKNVNDSQAKLQLLSHCIIDFPQRDNARIPLFEAAALAQSNEYAIGVIGPLLQSQFFTYPNPRAGDQEIISSGADEEDSSDDSSIPLSAAAKLSRAEHAKTAQIIAETMMHVDRLNDAVSYYKMARRSESSPVARKLITRKIADVQSQLRIQRQNSARQPILHEALEQDRVVRPRLIARAATPPKAASAKDRAKQ